MGVVRAFSLWEKVHTEGRMRGGTYVSFRSFIIGVEAPRHFTSQNAKRAAFAARFTGTTSRSRPSGTRCREREVASAIWSTEARPFARSTVGWVRGGRVAEGSRPAGCSDFQRSVSNKKGALRPCDAVSGAVSTNQGSLHL